MALSKLQAALLLVVREHAPDGIGNGLFLPEVRDRMRPGEGQLRRTQGKKAERVFRHNDPGPVIEFWFWSGGFGGGDMDGNCGIGWICDPRSFLLANGHFVRLCGENRLPGPSRNHFLPDCRGLMHSGDCVWRGGNGFDGRLLWFWNLEHCGFSGRTVQRVEDWRRGFLICRGDV